MLSKTFYHVEIDNSIGENQSKKVNDYLQPQVKLLKYMTIWRLDNPNVIVNVLYRMITMIRFTLLLLATASQAAQIYLAPDLSKMSSAIDLSTLTLSASYKMMFMFTFQDSYIRLVQIVQENFIERSALHLPVDRNWFPDTETIKMMDWIRRLNMYIKMYAGSGCFVVVLWCISPIFETTDDGFSSANATNLNGFRDYSKILPLNAWVPFNVDRSPTYEIVYVLELVPMVDAGMVYITGDAFFFMTIYLVCGQLEILKCTLINMRYMRSSTDIVKVIRRANCENIPSISNRYFCLTSNLEDRTQRYKNDNLLIASYRCENGVSTTNESTENYKALNDIFIDCINHHQLLLQVLDDVDKLNRTLITADLLHAIISLSFALFQTTESENLLDYVKVATFVVVSFFHQYLNSFFGEYLIQQQMDISEAVYSVPWEDGASIKFRNALKMVIQRSQKPVILSGLKMYFLRYKTFMEFMKALISYFMVLRQLHDEGK